MIKPKVGFIVYGVHKDGLLDPMGKPFIDEKLLAAAKKALTDAGLELVEHNVILATKAEARECFSKFKKMDDLDAVVLFSGTWVWAAHLIAASPLCFTMLSSLREGPAGCFTPRSHWLTRLIVTLRW